MSHRRKNNPIRKAKAKVRALAKRLNPRVYRGFKA